MTTTAVAERMTDVFQQVFNDDTLVPVDATTADDIEAWDSVMHVTLVFSLEEEFGIELVEIDQVELQTVGDLRRMIERQLDGSS